MKSDAKQITDYFLKAEEGMRLHWTNALSCAVIMIRIKDKVGEDQFDAWLIKHCPKVNPEAARHFINMLLKSEIGKEVMDKALHPDQQDFSE